MKYLLIISCLLFTSVSWSESGYLYEEEIEDTWTVKVLTWEKEDSKEWDIIASVNGGISHGDRLKIRIVPTDIESCEVGNPTTSFYVVNDNLKTLELKDEVIPAIFKNTNINVRILYAHEFLMGYSIFIHMGSSKLELLSGFFKDENEVTLKLLDSKTIKISDYFDIHTNTFSLIGLEGALNRAKNECIRIVKERKIAFSKDVSMEDLVEREGLYYEKYSDAPFTGNVVGKVQGKIIKGKREGEWLTYYKNGQLQLKDNYKDGKYDGELLWYDQYGQLKKKMIYKDGVYKGIIKPVSDREVSEVVDEDEDMNIKPDTQVTDENLKLLREYKKLIHEKVKIIAMNNYPESAVRRKIGGNVHLVFTLKKDGNIKDIKIGPKSTTDSTALINAGIEALKKALPINMDLPDYDFVPTFSIIIRYKADIK